MTLSPSRLGTATAGALTLLLVSCAGHRPPSGPAVTGAAGSVGLYKVRLVDADGEQHRFRMWLFAELPDRLHGEVISPVGSTLLIVDAGDDRLSVALVRDRVAFVGKADPDVLEALLGVRLSLRELVGLLLTDEPPRGDHEVIRVGRGDGRLPEELQVRSPGRSLSLNLKQRQPFAPEEGMIGRGVPPAGMAQRSLDELDLLELRSGS